MIKSNEKKLNKTHHTIEFLLYGKKSESADPFNTSNLNLYNCESLDNERFLKI